MVRDDGGRPLARARLSVWPAGAVERRRPSGSGPAPLGSGVADVGGHFRLAQLPAGDLRLEIQHPDYPTSVHATTAGTYAMITVPFPGGIAGEVRAKATGAAVARGRLDAVGPGGAKATHDDPQGRHVPPAAAGAGPLAADHGRRRLPHRRAGAGRAGQLRAAAKRLSASCASSSMELRRRPHPHSAPRAIALSRRCRPALDARRFVMTRAPATLAPARLPRRRRRRPPCSRSRRWACPARTPVRSRSRVDRAHAADLVSRQEALLSSPGCAGRRSRTSPTA